MWSLDKIFGLYTVCFLGITVLIGIGERIGLFSNQMIGWIFMALSLAIYVVIGVLTRTSNPDQYYVAGRGVPSIYNGMATGSDWMSAASFISMAGLISALGFFGLGYVMGWTGGYLLLAVLLGPYLRQFGAYTIPDFLAARYGGNTARIVGVVGAIICSFTYLTAQVTGVGLIVARFIGIDYNIGVFVGLVGVLFCSVLGGMKSVTWTQVAQYIILIISYLVPVVYLSWTLFSIPIPELTYGRLLQQNNATELRLTADVKEKETRALWKKDADDAAAKIKAGGLPESEVEKLQAQQRTALIQARPLAPSETAKFGNTLTVPTGTGMWNFLALTFCLMVGTAGLPHILTRYYTTPSVREARTSVAWSLFFIFLLYFTAPAYAAFARFAVFTRLVGAKISELPGWVTFWQPAGLFTVVDKNGDGLVQWADFVVRSTDFVVLSMPEVAGLPFVITGLVMAGGLAAALSTADGLLLTIANAISHDLYYNVIDPSASLVKRLTITKILLVVTAIASAYTATFRFAVIAELVAWAFSLAGASFFPALVMGIWWKRANKQGAVWGMIAGLAVTTYYLIGSRFYGVSWFGTQTIASAIFGLPIGFLVIWIVSLLTAPPPKEVQDLVASVRYPKSGQAYKGDPLGRDLREAPVRYPGGGAGGGGSHRPRPFIPMDDLLLRLGFLVRTVVPFVLFMASIYLALHALFAGLISNPASPLLWFFGVVTGPLTRPVRALLPAEISERRVRLIALGVYVALWLASRAVLLGPGGGAGVR